MFLWRSFVYSGTCNSVRLKIRLPHQDGGHDFMRGQSYRLIQGVVSFHIPGNLQTIMSYVLVPIYCQVKSSV